MVSSSSVLRVYVIFLVPKIEVTPSCRSWFCYPRFVIKPPVGICQLRATPVPLPPCYLPWRWAKPPYNNRTVFKWTWSQSSQNVFWKVNVTVFYMYARDIVARIWSFRLFVHFYLTIKTMCSIKVNMYSLMNCPSFFINKKVRSYN